MRSLITLRRVNQLHRLLIRFSWTENIRLINAARSLCVSGCVCVCAELRSVNLISVCVLVCTPGFLSLCQCVNVNVISVCVCVRVFVFDPPPRQDTQRDGQRFASAAAPGSV